ncbi:MAG: hypothetical protein IJM76_05700 [Lachnospiraceae bacterium]|nr:hypothetical protein [Lachnospiraceae bacterium]
MEQVTAKDDLRAELSREVASIEELALSMAVTSDVEYREAADLVKRVKSAAKRVDVYWEPLRVGTYDAYKAVMAHKAEMSDPLKSAEKILKAKMSDYSAEVERKRREEEERLRKLAQEEMEKKLKEAEEAEKSGDMIAAQAAIMEAAVMESTAETVSVGSAKPEVSGISRRKDWVITNINHVEVPVEVAGVEIRPVDEKAVIALIRASKGRVVIPGVTYEERDVLSVRV